MNIAALIAKLETERLNEDENDPRYCVGWNRYRERLLEWVRAELAAAGTGVYDCDPLNLSLKAELVGGG